MTSKSLSLGAIVLLTVLSSCTREMSPVGNWQVVRIEGEGNANETTDPKLRLEIKPDGTFEGWFLNADGFYEASRKWDHARDKNQPALRFDFTARDGTSVQFTKDEVIFRGNLLVDEWHPPYDKVFYQRSP